MQQLGIDWIFSAPYRPQSNAKLEVFHKYLKPTLKKLCEKHPTNWDKYLNQVLASHRVTLNLATAETPFFLVYGRDPNLPPHQLLEVMQHFLGDPDSGMLNLETYRLVLATAKKTLDENRFKKAQKTMERKPPPFRIGDCMYFKNKQPSKWDLKWRPRYRTVCTEHNGHFLHIENHATGKICSCNMKDIILEPPIEFWNIDTQFSRAGKCIKHPTYLPTITLNDLKKKPISTITVNNDHISPLQHSIHDYLHHSLIRKGIGRISYFSISSTGIPNMPLLYHNGTHFFRTPGMSLKSF